jgi:hypothetical protein
VGDPACRDFLRPRCSWGSGDVGDHPLDAASVVAIYNSPDDLKGKSPWAEYGPLRSHQRRPRARTRANRAECDTRGNGPKTHNLGRLAEVGFS